MSNPTFIRPAAVKPHGSAPGSSGETVTASAASADSGTRRRTIIDTIGEAAREYGYVDAITDAITILEMAPPLTVDALNQLRDGMIGDWRDKIENPAMPTLALKAMRMLLESAVIRDPLRGGQYTTLATIIEQHEFRMRCQACQDLLCIGCDAEVRA